ncbi:hypothetical protein CC1G_10726 [Coprinopsis cinerea okayama7|uniref:Uncharacterized protein n=1 Tax=Coprinopsis cinerea (strain Okayama-7 / 130 / ATCC MYA-4618 / FGSC 9003) TaxID=240176 RepID=A8NBE5_COPC7|nr:hypothetical protein CC1G_10726 [Coprinopsis cinerea okayama7\|eukprot:XP_001832144.2 hypothetical protein CC1G_10726 [Coprinopsis cinerea okayama7\
MFAKVQLLSFVTIAALANSALAGPIVISSVKAPTTCSSTNTITRTAGGFDPNCSVVVTVTQGPQPTCTRTSTITRTLLFNGEVTVVPRDVEPTFVTVLPTGGLSTRIDGTVSSTRATVTATRSNAPGPIVTVSPWPSSNPPIVTVSPWPVTSTRAASPPVVTTPTNPPIVTVTPTNHPVVTETLTNPPIVTINLTNPRVVSVTPTNPPLITVTPWPVQPQPQPTNDDSENCSVVVTVTQPGTASCPFTNTITQTLAQPTAPADPDCSVVVTVTERLPRPTTRA